MAHQAFQPDLVLVVQGAAHRRGQQTGGRAALHFLGDETRAAHGGGPQFPAVVAGGAQGPAVPGQTGVGDVFANGAGDAQMEGGPGEGGAVGEPGVPCLKLDIGALAYQAGQFAASTRVGQSSWRPGRW
ncbi:hypothetical protein GCM10010275_69470 [Streptomyces litmocidini]|nr:hypothetical protein GCM10010275_69470 [Streptomyces litmocidini]